MRKTQHLSQHGNERVKCDIYIAVREALEKSLLDKVCDTEAVTYSICTKQ